MVYSNLYIVNGILLTLNHIETIIGRKLEEDEDAADAVHDMIKKSKLYQKRMYGCATIRLYNFPCCSASNGKWFLLGIEAHQYYRKTLHCANCEDYSVCDICIGETSGGVYDVEAISQGPVEVPADKLCERCYSDKVNAFRRCDTCFMRQRPKVENSKPPTYGHSYDILRLAKEFGLSNTETHHYYMVDDCLSCT